MQEWRRRSWAEINLNNLLYNSTVVRRLCAPGDWMATVKADAYGHGAVPIAQFLAEHGVKRFTVSNLDEAIELRKNGRKGEILILGYTPPEYAAEIERWQLVQTVFSLSYAQQLERAVRSGRIAIHLKLDTGMARIGFLTAHLQDCLQQLEEVYALKHLQVTGCYSHLSCADDAGEEAVAYTKGQIERFQMIKRACEEKGYSLGNCHLQNSAALLAGLGTGYPLARPGIVLYGLQTGLPASRDLFRPLLSFKSVVILIKEVPAGTPVGYGGSFVTQRPTRLATVPVGYADGYPRGLSNRGKVWIDGQLAPVVGRVCMDQLMVDVTDVQVNVEDEVTLFGEEGEGRPTADALAADLQTIGYEIVCGLSRRVPRIYRYDGEIVQVWKYL